MKMVRLTILNMIFFVVYAFLVPLTDGVKYEGNDCHVIVNSTVEFDLSPLKLRPFHLDTNKSDDYVWSISVCRETNGCHKDSGGCHLDKNKHNSYYSLGQWNDKVIYDNETNQLQLIYYNGSSYRDANRTPRKTIIDFICDENSDNEKVFDQMTHIKEDNRTYHFELRTKYACPRIPLCYYRNLTHFIDLRPLNGSYNVGNYTIEFCNEKNLIHPTNGLEMSYGKFYKAFMLSTNSPLRVIYDEGNFCEGYSKFSSIIEFECDRNLNDTNDIKLASFDNCTRTFKWKTSVVCNWTNVEFNKCIIDSLDYGKIDVESLKVDKVKLNETSTVYFDLCGSNKNINKTMSGCEDSAVCLEVKSNGKNYYKNLGSIESKLSSTNYQETSIIYTGKEKCDKGNKNVTTEILFICDRKKNVDSTVEYVVNENDDCKWIFELRRSIFCLHYVPKIDHHIIPTTIKPSSTTTAAATKIITTTTTISTTNKTTDKNEDKTSSTTTTTTKKTIDEHENENNTINGDPKDYPHMAVKASIHTGEENSSHEIPSKSNLLRIFWFFFVPSIAFIFVYFLIFTLKRDGLRSLFKAPLLPTFRYSSSPENSDTAKLVALDDR